MDALYPAASRQRAGLQASTHCLAVALPAGWGTDCTHAQRRRRGRLPYVDQYAAMDYIDACVRTQEETDWLCEGHCVVVSP